MSRAYHRQDALQRSLIQRAERQRQSSSDKCRQIVDSWKKDGLTKEILESIKDLPINKSLTEEYKKEKDVID